MEVSEEIWVLTGDKVGDNNQALQLARSLKQTYRVLSLSYNFGYRLPNALLGGHLWSLSEGRSEIKAPWPKLVIGTGRRSVCVALYIKKASGGLSRIVRIGRPRADLDLFDLVITTPQYRLPSRSNLISLPLPVASRDRPMLMDTSLGTFVKDEAESIVVLVGGDSDPYRFDWNATHDLGRKLRALAQKEKRRLWVSYGRRVQPENACALDKILGGHLLKSHRFGDPGDNPYTRMLASAELFVVTTDSASMMADAVQQGRPVFLYTPTYQPSFTFAARLSLEAHIERMLGEERWGSLVASGLYVPVKQMNLLTTHVLGLTNVARLGERKPCVAPPDVARVLHGLLGGVEC